ncbi:DUF1592 domain-containing protein [Roseimaritima ulvae]|uniref:Planctomycete cytochrome C n=1 Tax=Roseimaritima ulvae TaxID=980254 RepID=A0A5B9QYV9_9BACT|nr:DUF1592 domain-containing protein [Roseimaritima ulvae]QEG39163.1 hypothetical protein UC8_11240 [Roseimaritima ulvae]
MKPFRFARRHCGLLAVAFGCLIGIPNLWADTSQTFFRTYCIDCHGDQTQEADLRLDTLAPPTAETQTTWLTIMEVIDRQDMPPQGEPRPTEAERQQVLSRIAKHLTTVCEPMPALRRMNRIEYEHTVQDLLGIDTPLADLLPEDGSVQGFDNVAGGLHLSAILMERYLEAADAAFDGVIRRIEPLPAETRRAVLMEQKENIEAVKKKKGGVITSQGAFVDFTPGWPPSRIDPAHPIEDGVYRCRIAVWPHHPGPHRTLSAAVFVGPLFGPGKRRFMGMYDVTGTADQPRIIEFTTRMEEAESLHILPWIYPEHVTWRDKEEPRPGIAIAWAETHGPLDQSFPSRSQTQLFGDAPTLSLVPGAGVYMRHRRGVRLHYVDSSAPRQDAERIIREFVPRAFRRPVEDALVDRFVQLTLHRLDEGRTFEQAVRAGVTAVLCSPHFLLLNQQPVVDDYTLASRLSYFLWSSMPDAELLQLAAEGKLRDSDVRHQQVERMIQDAKFERFVENFVGQWLDLRDIEFTTPDKTLYPEYDELLLRSMVAETRGFFRHLVEQDLSVLNVVDSDFTVLNQRLATHYGLPAVKGHETFRVVQLPEDSVRGGVLTHASVLKVTANGTSTSPVIRGAWVLDKISGQPPSPPPAGVPAVEPDIRGATTIREQLKLHSQDPSCARCHDRIDPPGFALEEFDVIGGHRQWYRSLGKAGQRVNKTNYRMGPNVEQGGQSADGRAFKDFQDYRRQLLEQPDRIARAMAEKLLIYGCGRPVTAADRQAVDGMLESARAQDLGLRSMLHAVTDSELFLRP